MVPPRSLDQFEEKIDDVVHTLHCRYPWFATFRIVRHVIATATLGLLTKLGPVAPPVASSRNVRRRIQFSRA